MVPKDPVDAFPDGSFGALAWALAEIPNAASTGDYEIAHGEQKGVIPKPPEDEVPEDSSRIVVPGDARKRAFAGAFDVS